MKFHDIITEDIYYHISNDPNLKVDKDYEPRQGQLGKVFYITSEPDVWEASLGEREFIYTIDARNLKIAKGRDYPSNKELMDWALENGYMEMKPLTRPNGEPVLDINDKPMIRPVETEKALEIMWQDPMTGSRMNGLYNQYLKEKGFDGYEAEYSRDGHQIGVWNIDKIKVINRKIMNP